MRKVIRLAVALLLALPVTTKAQSRADARDSTSLVARGRVLDAASDAPIASATVVSLVGGNTVVSGPNGAFRLRVPANTGARVVAARLGFEPDTLAVSANGGELIFRLKQAALRLDAVVVSAERGYSAASSEVIRDVDIQLRPRESSQELLRLVPGLVIAQHAGGGKAEQIFLRGFDADHGTDVAISVDGTPVNMVSHAHGQGYADLHFLMPEVIERADVRKGPYDARDGDLATAGAIAFRTLDRLDAGRLEVRGGSFDTRHAIALLPFGGNAAHAGGYLAGSFHASDGPFERSQDYRRGNGYFKWTSPVRSGAQFVATASAFGARWDASGQVPERALERGLIGRFGAIDPTEGGRTERYDVSLALRSATGSDAGWEARVYGVRYRFDLFSNFTFFAEDSINGDGIEQEDDRWMVGGEARYGRQSSLLGRHADWQMGVGNRADFTDVGLYHAPERRRIATPIDARVVQNQLFAWARERVQLAERLRLELGMRGDVFRFGVRDRLEGAVEDPDRPHVSGVRWQAALSPRASLAYDLAPAVTLFANAGAGFHSNDARGVIVATPQHRVLPRATSAELGVRWTWSAGSLAAALWGLDLRSELVWSGDGGTTEASGRTRRTGIDLEARARVLSWLWADADLNLSRGRLRDEPPGQNRIPLAPTLTSTGGLSVLDAAPLGGGVRYRHVGSRPAIEDNSVRARGYSVWEAFGRVDLGRARLLVTVDNIFDVKWNEAQFATTSRLRGEPEPLTELHFTPGAPRSVQVGIQYRF